MSGVRMTHPGSGGEYFAQPSQIEHLESAGWEVADGQDAEYERWPTEAQRFEGQPQVRIYHPITKATATVAESAVATNQSAGWKRVDEDAVTEAVAVAGDDLDDLTVDQLKDEARGRDLPVSGTKAELLERLRGAEQDEPESESPAEPATQESEE